MRGLQRPGKRLHGIQPTQSLTFTPMRLVRYSQPLFRDFTPVRSFPRSSWSGLETEIDRLFETALGHPAARRSSSQFPVDLYEDKNNTYVRAALPGVRREDIAVEIADGYLTLSATRKTPAAEGTGAEETSFTFSRAVSLADEVQSDRVSAAYENGVLTVTLPKREEAKPKKIAVEVK